MMVVLGKEPLKPKPHQCEPPQKPVPEGEWRPWSDLGNVHGAAEGVGSVWRCDQCWDLWMVVGGAFDPRWIRYPYLSPSHKRRCRKMDKKNPIFYRPRLNSAKQWKVVRHRDGTTSGLDSPYVQAFKQRAAMKQAQSRRPPTGPSGQSKRSK
ncbi:hypothetical protein SEA_TEATEALATTE_47 [Gordonia phage Teatealatte]|uniref:Uncharacterized protein n=2 Tax=Demosthenesvirus katyusha TaxID=1982108 RepID=A0A345MCI4_9CAUD|nr:hypothetical protein SEA_TEATEALATTE_47 [Gordonia phage Teatealatte]QBP29605.1 hypothetical protein SEA_TREDGE_47 [Gordonia phage Tredge]